MRYDRDVKNGLRILLPLLVLMAACSESAKPSGNRPSKTPVSVRGWFARVDTPISGEKLAVTAVEIEQARLEAIFSESNVSVDNINYATGGMQTNGAFIVLDVPPGDAQLDFVFPGIPTSLKLTMKGIPPKADVFLPSLGVSSEGIRFLEPERVQIRVLSADNSKKMTGASATINGVSFPIEEVPREELAKRREYPVPTGARSITKLK